MLLIMTVPITVNNNIGNSLSLNLVAELKLYLQDGATAVSASLMRSSLFIGRVKD